jgi:hypothetical protein
MTASIRGLGLIPVVAIFVPLPLQLKISPRQGFLQGVSAFFECTADN